MKNFPLSVGFIAWAAIAGCGGGGGGGGNPAAGGSGGGAGSPAAGGGGGKTTSTAGSGGVGGKTNGGTNNADAASSTGDAWVANADHAGLNGDSAIAVGSCPSFTPCGGDIVGTWYLQAECVSEFSSSVTCVLGIPTIDVSGYRVTYTFTSSGTMSISASGAFNETIQYSPGCLGGDAGAAQTCSTLAQKVQQSWQVAADAGMPSMYMTKFDCSIDSTQACVCNETLTVSQTMKTGSYTTSGNQVTVSASSGSPLPDGGLGDAGAGDPADYCVSGDTLTLRPADSSGNFLIILTK